MDHSMPSTKGANLTERAYKQIRGEILACRLAPGQKLVISELANSLGFSLGAVREALAGLTSEGFVVSETNKGYRVAPITQEDLEDLTRTRILIEAACLNDAIEHGDLSWESGIVSSLFELSRTPLSDPEDPAKMSEQWAARHAKFHKALVAGCQGPWLLRLRELLYVQSERYRSVSVPLARRNRDVDAEHKAIADAAIARDKLAAETALRRHLELTTRILIDADVTGQDKVRAAAPT